MNKTLALCFGLLLSSAAMADLCNTKEYAQYKDEGKSAYDRQFMAWRYCQMTQFVKILEGATSRDQIASKRQCEAEMSKIIQVLDSANDSKARRYAFDGCPEGLKLDPRLADEERRRKAPKGKAK